MNIPADLKYTKNDEWVRVEGDTATIGITDYAQDQLSDVVYAEVSVSPGDSVQKGGVVGAIESVKAASDVYSPVSGEVVETNSLLDETPEALNTDPFGEAWMLKVRMSDPSELDGLMDPDAYEAYLADREH